MNHFLLPGDPSHEKDHAAMRYGAFAMELLINDLLCQGARRGRISAKLFGGACLMKGLTDIGRLNAEFAERFLAAEGIQVVAQSLRGNRGRRVQFWPVTGRARQTLVAADQAAVLQVERTNRPVPLSEASGSVELF